MSGLAINTSIEQQVQVMTRTLLSRPNMEKVARMTDMNIQAKTPKDMEELVTGLMENVKLDIARSQDNLYRVAYQNSNPALAKNVVQSLLTILVEGSLGNKRKDTDAAQRFIEDQIKLYEGKLSASENILKEFKQKHLGMMPGQGGDYFSKLGAAQQSVNEATLALREAETRRDQLKRQLTDEDPEVAGTATESVAANPEIDARIQGLQKNLDQLRLGYTEQHPDIVNTKRVIAQLEEQKKKEAKTKKPVSAAAATQNPYYQQLSLSLAEAEAQAASMRARVSEYTARYNTLRMQANMVPQVETDLVQLTRDYEVNKSNYVQLLARRGSAQMAEDMEAQTDVIEFRVIDPPYVPPTPSYPNKPLLLSVVLLLALAGGAGVAFVISQVRPVLVDRAGIADVTEFPVLGSVTMVWNNAQIKSRRKKLLAWMATVGSLVSAYAVLLGISFLLARSGA